MNFLLIYKIRQNK